MGLLYLMAPISLTVLPRFTELLAKQKQEQLVRTYHVSAQLMTVVLTPAALVIALFSRELLAIWTRNDRIAERAGPLLTVLAMAVLLRTITEIPYIMQLAQGRTRLAVYTNIVAVALYLPLLAVLVARYGAIGAAAAMAILHGAKFLIWGHVVHAKILPTEKWRWYFVDIGGPAVAAAAVVVGARLLIPRGLFSPVVTGVLLLAAVGGMAVAVAAMAAPLMRERARTLLPLLRQFASARKVSNPNVP
jgi:O-antigen/teichoic acid export membrane protein